MSDATVIQGHWKGQVIHLNPVQPFGRRGTPVIGRLPGSLGEVLDVAIGCERPSDRAEQSRIKDAARAARVAFDAKAVHPDLQAELAAEIGVIAKLCGDAARTAKDQTKLRAAVTLLEVQGILETVSAEVSPLQPEQPA